MTETYPKINAREPAIIGPTTVAIDRVELKIQVEVERELFSIR